MNRDEIIRQLATAPDSVWQQVEELLVNYQYQQRNIRLTGIYNHIFGYGDITPGDLLNPETAHRAMDYWCYDLGMDWQVLEVEGDLYACLFNDREVYTEVRTTGIRIGDVIDPNLRLWLIQELLLEDWRRVWDTPETEQSG